MTNNTLSIPTIQQNNDGISLPPQVRGDVKGEVCLHIEDLIWDVQCYHAYGNIPVAIHIKWWGERSAGCTLIPSTHYDRLRTQFQNTSSLKTTAVYPVKTGKKQLFKYFADMGALALDVVRLDNPHCVIGKTFIAMGTAMDVRPIQGSFSVHAENGAKIAILKAFLGVTYFVKGTYVTVFQCQERTRLFRQSKYYGLFIICKLHMYCRSYLVDTAAQSSPAPQSRTAPYSQPQHHPYLEPRIRLLRLLLVLMLQALPKRKQMLRRAPTSIYQSPHKHTRARSLTCAYAHICDPPTNPLPP
eukprot:GEZU01025598.1.p1 GENE.GEZU01025598.1~~GEZU01025598.1.p1  ORF type:complete len:300 (+),score=8.74 GEZU01025598.1:127-1026(+)